MKHIFALITATLLTFALADDWQACETIGLYLDKTNSEATLELVYATATKDLEASIFQFFTEYTPTHEPNVVMFNEYAIGIFQTADGQLYAVAVKPLSETSFILCGYELYQEVERGDIS